MIMGNNGKNQFLLFDYYIMLLVTQTFVHFAYSKRKSITEEMEQWWGGMEKFLSDVDIISIRIFLLPIILKIYL